MNRTTYSMCRGDLAGALDRSFVADPGWPIDRASLAALVDIGMSPHQIAHYFSVTPAEVLWLLNAAGSSPRPRCR